MDSTKINDWMQVIGIFAVVASLIFVGLQMKQSQEIAVAAQYQERANTSVMFWVESKNDQSSKEFWGRGFQSFLEASGNTDGAAGWAKEMTVSDIGFVYLNVQSLMTQIDNHYFQYQSGFLDEESWAPFRARLVGGLRQPPMEDFWAYTAYQWRQSLRDIVAEIQNEIEPEAR
jgi:hypothetical protein